MNIHTLHTKVVTTEGTVKTIAYRLTKRGRYYGISCFIDGLSKVGSSIAYSKISKLTQDINAAENFARLVSCEGVMPVHLKDAAEDRGFFLYK